MVHIGGSQVSFVAENLRYLLWKEGIETGVWPEQLAHWAGCSAQIARQILEGTVSLPASQQARIADAVGCEEEGVQFKRLVEAEDIDILTANLAMLINGLAHGQKSRLAEKLGINRSTVTRWISGGAKPDREMLTRLLAIFNLPPDTDLKHDALFLEMNPVTTKTRRQLLHTLIDKLPDRELHELFPACVKLLGWK